MADPNPTRPHLVAVPKEGTSPVEADAPTPPEGMSKRIFWLLAVLLLATAVGLFVQAENVRSLERANAVLTGELATARATIDAYAERFDSVRASVSGLQEQLAELSELVREDPAVPPSPAPEAPAPSAP